MMEPEQPLFTYSTPQKVLESKDSYDQPYTLTQYYINSTIDNITIVNRNNLAYTAPAHSGGYNGANLFIVRNVYKFRSRSNIVSTINNISSYFNKYNSTNKELSIVIESLLKICDSDPKANIADIAIEYSFKYTDLVERKKIYCPNTDNLICLGVYEPSQINPFSHEGRAYTEYQKFIDSRKVSGVFIEVIDNESSIGSRFIYAAKQVVEIPVHKDILRPSGVYFTRAINNRLDQTYLDPKFVNFTEAENELGLYKTKEEATSGGNPELIVKQQHLNLNKELEDLKITNNILKENISTETVKRESILSKTKHQHELDMHNVNVKMIELQRDLELAKRSNIMLNEQLTARSAVREDYYDQRSEKRREHGDLIKYGLIIATAGLSLYTLYAKNK